MIRMKKKDKAPEAAPYVSTATGDAPMDTGKSTGAEDGKSDAKDDDAGLSLLGIGGKQIKAGTSKKAGKKRTPGEIRIQKGVFYCAG